MKTLTLLVASASLLVGAGAAHAAPPTAGVAFSSAELMTPQGRAEIRERITAAARQVCAVETRLAVQLNSQRRACMAQAIETAEAQLEIKFAQASQSRLARGAEPVAENG